MRQIVGAIVGIIMVLYFFYLVYPMFYNESNTLPNIVNMSDPNIVTSTNLGTGFYNALPLIPILGAAFLLINFSLKRGDVD